MHWEFHSASSQTITAKIDPKRPQYLRREQRGMRADSDRDLRETIVNQDEDSRNVGQKVILPVIFC